MSGGGRVDDEIVVRNARARPASRRRRLLVARRAGGHVGAGTHTMSLRVKLKILLNNLPWILCTITYPFPFGSLCLCAWLARSISRCPQVKPGVSGSSMNKSMRPLIPFLILLIFLRARLCDPEMSLAGSPWFARATVAAAGFLFPSAHLSFAAPESVD